MNITFGLRNRTVDLYLSTQESLKDWTDYQPQLIILYNSFG